MSNGSGDPRGEMSLLEHLGELRTRLLVSAAALVVASIAAYFVSDAVFELLARAYRASFDPGSLIGTGPAEAFILKIKVAIFAGLLLASPVIFHQLWLFIEPGLYDSEKRLVFPFVIVTTALFVGGVCFCHELVLPFAMEFFRQQYASIGLTPTIKMSEYLAMVIRALLAFGIVFEMPVLAFFLARVGILTWERMVRGTRYAIVAIFVIAAALTPPDVLTQLLMAGPLLVLYGVSTLIVRVVQRRASPHQGEEQSGSGEVRSV